jgi:hypothetical protein
MKTSSKTRFPYIQFDTLCIRTPLFSVDFFKELTMGVAILDEDVLEKLNNPVILEALFLASPDFYFQVEKWRNGDIKDPKKARRIKLALLKYLTRMATRCTPFGLFAGCTSGKIASENQIELRAIESFKKQTRYDMHFLVSLADYLSNKKNIRSQIKFYPNSTLYKVGNRYRYVEYTYVEKRRQHSLESVSYSTYLDAIIKSAENGETLSALVKILTELDIEKQQAEDFLDELVANQILSSALEPSVTGPDFLEQLRLKLSGLQNVQNELALLAKMQSHLTALDQSLGNTISSYLTIKDLISTLEIPFELKYLFQTDLFTSVRHKSMGYPVLKKVKQGIAFLNKISAAVKNPDLERFKTAFNKRFEGQKIPLLQVLDVESGIGYVQNPSLLEATPFLDDIEYVPETGANRSYDMNWSSFRSLLLEKVTKALSNNSAQIALTDHDFAKFDYDWRKAPETISALVEVVIENGKEKVIMDYCGPGAAMLLGRFCYGDAGLMKMVNEIVSVEESALEGKILAEIVHLPESRTGNILRRPNLRSHEIPCLGKSDLAVEKQIPLHDILVCVEQSTVKLYSKKLGKEILPRLTNAHNYSANALPVYHFLCDLQYQDRRKYAFSWGNLLMELKQLPRVTYKDVILSRATWNLEKKDIESILDAYKKNEITKEKMDSWRADLKIPKIVQLTDGDNTLLVNFENATSTEMFLDSVKNKYYFQLEEFLFDEQCFIKRKDENYCNQFVIAFYNQQLIQADKT